MSLGLCAHISGFAQTDGADNDGWQSLEGFLAEPDGESNYNSQALGPGDVITVTIKKVPTLSQNYTIDENGEINFPLIGRVKAQGATPNNFAEKLTVLYEKDYLVDPLVTVSIFARSLPTNRPATPIYAPLGLTIDNKPLALNIIEPDPAIAQETVTQTLLDPLTGLPESAPQIVPEVAPEPVIESAPLLSPSPAQKIVISEPLPVSLADSHWSIEGSSEDFIRFLADGDMAGALGCNSFFARYDAAQIDMNIRAVTSTNIPCSDQSKPQEFIDNLKQTQSYLFTDNNLLLLDGQSQVIFTLQPK